MFAFLCVSQERWPLLSHRARRRKDWCALIVPRKVQQVCHTSSQTQWPVEKQTQHRSTRQQISPKQKGEDRSAVSSSPPGRMKPLSKLTERSEMLPRQAKFPGMLPATIVWQPKIMDMPTKSWLIIYWKSTDANSYKEPKPLWKKQDQNILHLSSICNKWHLRTRGNTAQRPVAKVPSVQARSLSQPGIGMTTCSPGWFPWTGNCAAGQGDGELPCPSVLGLECQGRGWLAIKTCGQRTRALGMWPSLLQPRGWKVRQILEEGCWAPREPRRAHQAGCPPHHDSWGSGDGLNPS